jgi:hypothetical protein
VLLGNARAADGHRRRDPLQAAEPIVGPTTLEQCDLTFAFVMRHANTGFEYIVRFLPSLHYAESRALEDVPMPR